ncbi:MAG TPA: hypothetical protein VL325_04390 [Pyrinomonadaceae bacterium]|nr:hypothetical protein [Pyrinomonadaceae bacterium]
MKRIVLIIVSLFILTINSALAAPSIPEIDRIRIAEVFRVGEKLQDQIWPDWHTAPFAMLFVTDDYEFLIRHPKPSDEFQSIGYDKLLKSEVFWRPRKFQKSFLATFPAFDRTPVIVVGKAENTDDKTSTRWLFVVLHEHFHQLQYSRPTYFDEVGALNLAHGDTSGMWQINFPFPYKDKSVADNFRRLTDLLMSASAAKNETERKTAFAKYLDARKAFAASLTADDYKYASFQLWQEGIARYTQYKMAELAGRKLKPSKAFRSLKDFTPFDKEATRLLAVIGDEMKQLDLAKWERVVFYPFGASEGLLLDKVNPNWRQKYFSEKFALEKFYPAEAK